MTIEDAGDDLQDRSASLGMNLSVMKMAEDSDDEEEVTVDFLLVGVNIKNDDAVEQFNEWKSDWEDELTHEGEDELTVPDDSAEMHIHEFTPNYE